MIEVPGPIDAADRRFALTAADRHLLFGWMAESEAEGRSPQARRARRLGASTPAIPPLRVEAWFYLMTVVGSTMSVPWL
jgi:hypothetical protein